MQFNAQLTNAKNDGDCNIGHAMQQIMTLGPSKKLRACHVFIYILWLEGKQLRKIYLSS